MQAWHTTVAFRLLLCAVRRQTTVELGRDGVAVLLPFLGVSSLDFGPLPYRGGLFSVQGWASSVKPICKQARLCATRFVEELFRVFVTPG